MKIIKSINKLHKEVNFKANIGFVPTMGALHKGHISLIESSKKKCQKTVVSIFVNPSQFNKKNDYKNYPRNISKDLKILKKLNVEYVFLPKKNDIFKNSSSMKIKINKKDKILCAKFRKGHFEGVLGVIHQFLKIIKARYMFLGEKDFQQIYIIKKYINKKFKTKIISKKTIRNNVLFAYSSRNNLLSKKDLNTGSLIAQIINQYHHKIKKKFKSINKLNEIKKKIISLGVKIEYFEVRNKYNLSKNINKANFKIFISYYINNIRLIDNF